MRPDTTPPTLVAAIIDSTGLELALTFSEPVTGHDGFTVDMTSGPASLTYVSGEGTATLRFSIAVAIESTEEGTLEYSPGDVADGAANAMAAISGFVVTNNSNLGGPEPDEFHYLRPDGTSTYLRPGGVDTYIRP